MIHGRHKSVPNELKQALKRVVKGDGKIVLNDICSARHRYTPGTLRLVGETENTLKLRGYFGAGIANFFIKCQNAAAKEAILGRL